MFRVQISPPGHFQPLPPRQHDSARPLQSHWTVSVSCWGLIRHRHSWCSSVDESCVKELKGKTFPVDSAWWIKEIIGSTFCLDASCAKRFMGRTLRLDATSCIGAIEGIIMKKPFLLDEASWEGMVEQYGNWVESLVWNIGNEELKKKSVPGTRVAWFKPGVPNHMVENMTFFGWKYHRNSYN